MSAQPTGSTASPLDPSHAMRALEDASEREQIFELLLRAARSRTGFAALLSVHAEHLRGRRALAEDGLDAARVAGLRIPRNAVPALEAAIASGAPAVAALATGEPFLDGLLEQLGGATPAALILPVAIAQRVVALVVAHRGEAPLPAGDVADLLPLVAASGPALARALAARSRAATPVPPSRPTPRPARAATSGYEILEVSIDPAALEPPPGEPPESRASLRESIDELRRREAWDELAEAIRDRIREGLAGGEPDEDEQLALLVELVRIEAELLGRPDRAIDALRGAQTIDAADPRVLDALEALLAAEARWGELADLLDRRAALTEDVRARAAILARIVEIARERLGDDDRAAAACERILARDPAHEVAARELAAIHEARGQWQPLAALLLDRASREDGGGIDTLAQVANIYEDRLGDAYAAFLVWLTVYRREPDRPHLIDQLDRTAALAAGGRARPDAAGGGAWDDLVAETEALAAELEAAHPEAAARAWSLIGRWHRDHTANRDAAARALERALRANPDDLDSLTELTELLRADGRWMDLIALLSRRAEAAQSPARRGEIYAELGALYEAQLGQPDQAIACYERALEGADEPAPLLVELHRLYLATEAWEALAELLPRLIAALGPSVPPAMLVDLHVELGGILAERLGRPDDAVRAFKDALSLDPRHAAAH
ncbi:MAG TPA: tetratricopeptide repeat protein, partial [Kofleriaceae bacterium]|nr:tetratricopeptide repeat protein [Kofleriaceae bacterium]